MRTVTATIPCDPTECWRTLTDATLLPAWLPGVKRVSVISRGADGLPTEVEFDYGDSRHYSLQYSYDHQTREMRFEPRMGKRDAVRGFMRVDVEGTGTTLVYGLEHGAARTMGEILLGDPAAIVAAFSAWMTSRVR